MIMQIIIMLTTREMAANATSTTVMPSIISPVMLEIVSTISV